MLKKELKAKLSSTEIICSECSTILEPSEEERITRKIHCTKCESLIDLNFDPPKIIKPENYIELLTTFNQGDIALIKSILEDSEINYYVTGENFLSVDPLIQPARFIVLDNQSGEAKNLLKDFELHIFGVSNKNETEN